MNLSNLLNPFLSLFRPSEPKIKNLFSDRTKWTTGYLARDANGTACHVSSKDAVSFCLLGAIEHCYGTADIKIYRKIRKSIEKLFPECDNIICFNDTQSYETIMKVVIDVNV